MSSPESTIRIPIVIVAGFLGSGKTTLIRDLLPPLLAENYRPYVILNDFLNAAIDAHALQGLGAEIKTLAAGCVCCDDASSLIRAILAVPRSENSMIIMEANGTTDPFRLLETLTLTPSLREMIGKVTQITVINESRWGKRWLPGDKLTERAQVRTASIVTLNRGDKASEKQRRRVGEDLAKLNPLARAFDRDEIVRLLIKKDLMEKLPAPEIANPAAHQHLHIAVQVEPPMMSEEKLRKWLIDLPREIIRIKGLARISETEMVYFQRTDDPLEAPRLMKCQYQQGMTPAAVFIGPGVDEETIRNSLRQPPLHHRTGNPVSLNP